MEWGTMDMGQVLCIGILPIGTACPLAFVLVSIRGENMGSQLGALYLFFIYTANLSITITNAIPTVPLNLSVTHSLLEYLLSL